MEKTQKERLFEDYPIPKAVASLAIPTVLSSLVMVLYNLADTYFVGMLNDPVENAGVALAAPVLLAFNAVNNLFGVGSSSLMSRSLGCKDYETVRRSSAFGFYGALFFGIIFSILCTVLKNPLLALLGADSTTFGATNDYMFWTVTLGAAPAILNVVLAYMVRSEGASMHASIGTMSGCILNMILDPFFVLPWGLDMGAAGAGCATFISNCVACGYFFVLLAVRRKSTYISISPRKFTLEKRIALSVFAVGIPAAIQNLLNVTGMTILNNFTAVYGASAIAAMGITQKVNSVPTQVAMGLSQGIMPLVSYNYASGNSKRMKKAIQFSMKISLSFLVVVAVLFFIFPGMVTRLFIADPEVITYGEKFLRGFSLAMPFLAVDFMAVGIFQAVGMGKHALAFALLRKLALEIPALFLLNLLFPLYGLAYAQFVAEFVLAIAAVIQLKKLFERLKKRDSAAEVEDTTD